MKPTVPRPLGKLLCIALALTAPSCGRLAEPEHAGPAEAPLAPAPASSLAQSAPSSARRGGPAVNAQPVANPPGAEPSRRILRVGGAALHVTFEPSALELGDAALFAWIERCARAVAGYLGTFPVPRARVRIRSEDGAGIRRGRAFPTTPPTLSIVVGRGTTPRQIERNWSLTHEMVHLAFPSVPDAHHWAEEGLATFVEPIARARIGWISEDAVWAEWIENMPRGLPGPADGGLDGTESWGRTYWGGALYWLLAEVELRKQSDGERGVADALRAITRASGGISTRWPLERALSTGDRATGTQVLGELYQRLRSRAVHVDLDALWRELGVELAPNERSVRYDATAPLASIRRTIVAGTR